MGGNGKDGIAAAEVVLGTGTGLKKSSPVFAEKECILCGLPLIGGHRLQIRLDGCGVLSGHSLQPFQHRLRQRKISRSLFYDHPFGEVTLHMGNDHVR
jgi:hypothetical protein